MPSRRSRLRRPPVHNKPSRGVRNGGCRLVTRPKPSTRAAETPGVPCLASYCLLTSLRPILSLIIIPNTLTSNVTNSSWPAAAAPGDSNPLLPPYHPTLPRLDLFHNPRALTSTAPAHTYPHRSRCSFVLHALNCSRRALDDLRALLAHITAGCTPCSRCPRSLLHSPSAWWCQPRKCAPRPCCWRRRRRRRPG